MILLSDAGILMDLCYVKALHLLPQLGKCEILTSVLEECRSPKQPELIEEIENSEYTIIDESPELLSHAIKLQIKGLSLQDKMNLCYAQDNNRILLAGDQLLRTSSMDAGVSVHGTIWIIERFHSKKLVPEKELCKWLDLLPNIGRRLPKKEIINLKTKLNCSDAT